MSEVFDDSDPFRWEDDDEGVSCDRCGGSNLHWQDLGKGWRLMEEDGSKHICNQPSADDFTDVSGGVDE